MNIRGSFCTVAFRMNDYVIIIHGGGGGEAENEKEKKKKTRGERRERERQRWPPAPSASYNSPHDFVTTLQAK